MMKNTKQTKFMSLLLAVAMCMSLVTVPAAAAGSGAAAAAGSFANVSGEGADMISLTEARSFKAVIPVDMTAAEAAAAVADAEVYLIYNDATPYVDPELYPHHTEGGKLSTWQTQYKTPLFSNVAVTAAAEGSEVNLEVTFDSNIYFGSNRNGVVSVDPSAPHSNGGAYLDLCGLYDLVVKVDDAEVGKVADVKIVPYDSFHTMSEVYDDIDAIVDYAGKNTSLYVVKGSMGKSQGDNGLASLDMPYLIVAKSKAAVDKWQSIKAEAESDPTGLLAKIENGTLGDYQVPILYSNVHANEVAATDGVLEFAWLLVETAASQSKSVSYKNLTGFTAQGEAALAEQMGAQGARNSIAVPDLVADTATYLGFLKGAADGSGEAQTGAVSASTRSRKLNLNTYYVTEDVTVTVNDLLDDVFFLIVPEENVEGRTYVTRTSSGGFDLNRDNSFQTQAETQNMTKFIAQWNPVSFTEFHGRVTAFQCEPCDPPHEPNFEYDLLAEHLVTGGEAFGIAAVANNATYNSYAMPQRDYLSYTGEKNADGSDQAVWDPWDDMSTSYTPQYAMLHGTVAYTVELPAYSDDASSLVAYGALGQSNYIAQNKAGYLTAQTKILERGVNNFNSNAFELVGQWFTDQYDIEGAEAELFRPEYKGEGQNGNFYPECYIIPLTGANQKNLDAADQMLKYLVRNGVKVMTADTPFLYQDVLYPAGTAVVSMYQAKRSVANGVLYDGTFITGWPALYSEGITAFNKTRGFDMVTCAEPEAYQTIAAACSEKAAWAVTSDAAYTQNTILKNTSEAAVAAVNELLKAGKSVSVILDGSFKGSFLVSKDDYESVSGKYLLTAEPMTEALTVKALTKAPVVYITDKPADNASGFIKTYLVASYYEYNYDRQAMELMGFETTEDASEADLIIGASTLDDAGLAAVQNGTPYIAYGDVANYQWYNPNLYKMLDVPYAMVGGYSMDALAYVTYPTETMINASYIAEGDDILYGYGAGYYTSVPEGAQILVQIDGSKEPLEGFLCAGAGLDAFLDNSIQAFTYQGKDKSGNDVDITLFANTLTNKVHQRDEFGFIANAAFAAVAKAESESVSAPVSGGSTGGSSGGGSSKPATPSASPAPTAAPSTDKAETVAVKVDATVNAETGVAAATVNKAAVADAVKADAATVVIEPTVKGEADKVDVAVAAAAVAAVAESGKDLAVKTDAASVKVDNAALKDLTDGLNVSVEAKKDEEGNATGVVGIALTSGDKTLDTVPGGVVVTLPASSGNVLVVVDDEGNETVVAKSLVDGGNAVALLDGSANVKVINNTKTFADVANDHWAKNAVNFASSHGIFQGVGDNNFAPDTAVTRAMMATVLYRLEGATATGTNAFADVAQGQWYTEAVAWANQAGIVTGYEDGKFGPTDNVTREQLVTMLYRYAKVVELDTSAKGDTAKFADGDSVSDWAQEAMTWAVGAGIIGGTENNTVAPTRGATRAEVSAILQRMVKLMLQ